jgi:hypothetical protein
LTVLEAGYVTTIGKACAGEWSEWSLKPGDRYSTGGFP